MKAVAAHPPHDRFAGDPAHLLEKCDRSVCRCPERGVIGGETGGDRLVVAGPTRSEPVKDANKEAEELIIYADNGPENNSHRTQFLYRIVEFAKRSGLKIWLVYYPPYHSKYNPIERSWSFLENHWNGALLDKVFIVLEWTKSMTWKCIKSVVHLLDKVYKKGVSLDRGSIPKIQPHITRHPELKKWDVTIDPVSDLVFC